jgi:hypothetical protein
MWRVKQTHYKGLPADASPLKIAPHISARVGKIITTYLPAVIVFLRNIGFPNNSSHNGTGAEIHTLYNIARLLRNYTHRKL